MLISAVSDASLALQRFDDGSMVGARVRTHLAKQALENALAILASR
jgi:hypothetical protein